MDSDILKYQAQDIGTNNVWLW